MFTTFVNVSGLNSARFASDFLSSSIPFFFAAPINLLYEKPSGRRAALIFTFQRRRKSPFLSRRCANEYAPAWLNASVAARSVFDLRKRKPLAALRVLRRFFRAFVAFLTLVMLVD